MAATSFNALVGHIQINAPLAPVPIIIAMLNKAARELCTRSSCWNEWQDVSLIAGQTDYVLVKPATYAAIRYVKKLSLNGRNIPVDDTGIVESGNPDASPGEPRFYTLLSDMTLKVFPSPSVADDGKVLKAQVTFAPSFDATEMPERFIDRYSEVLINGATYLLMAMPGKDWSNKPDAGYYESKFIEGVDKARIEVSYGYSNADLSVSAVRFGMPN